MLFFLEASSALCTVCQLAGCNERQYQVSQRVTKMSQSVMSHTSKTILEPSSTGIKDTLTLMTALRAPHMLTHLSLLHPH